MKDPIERQAAIEAVCLNNYHDITLVNGKPYTRGYRDGVLAKENDCIENIMNLPSAEPEQRWIPVSERLPERYGWYLCTLKDGRVNCYYWNKKGEWVDNGKKHFFDLYNIRSRYTGKEINPEQEGSVYWTDWVIAWMPLPEPYKEGNSDD